MWADYNTNVRQINGDGESHPDCQVTHQARQPTLLYVPQTALAVTVARL